MFAMRACRKSVMVGKALPLKAMEGIVRHMVSVPVMYRPVITVDLTKRVGTGRIG